MKKFNNKIKNPLSMLMYIIAIFLGLYTIFTIYCINIIYQKYILINYIIMK